MLYNVLVLKMPTDSISKLRIDLARWECFAFRITTQAVIDDTLAKVLSISSKRKLTRYYEKYTRNGISHSITLRLFQAEQQPNLYSIRISYECSEPRELTDWFEMQQTPIKPTQAFLQLCKLEATLLFRFDCSFHYKRGKSKILFDLPIKLEDETFNGITAIKFVKTERDKTLWENYIQLVDNDIMTHRVRFAKEAKCSLELPFDLLKQAKTISLKT